jgi:hypothetical protein
MAINIPLTDAEEARLRAQAASRATSPEALVAEWLRPHLGPLPPDGERPLLPVVEDGVFYRDRLEAVHRFFENASKGRPSIPLEALRREALYEDHD